MSLDGSDPGDDSSADERALKEAEERLRLALDSVGDGAWDWNVRSGEVFCSDRWYESLGYRRDELGPISRVWSTFLHSEDAPLVRSATDAHLRGHTRQLECEYRVRTKSGSHRWMQVRGRVIERTPEGEPLRMVGTNSDISLAKRVQLSLDELEGRCRSIVNTAGCIIIVIDADGRIQEWNPAAERIYGFPAETVRGKRYADWFLPEAYREPVQHEIDRLMSGGPDTRNFENPILSRDGTEHAVLWNATALRNREGAPWAVLAIGQDISDWRHAERAREIAIGERRAALERVRQLAVELERCTGCGAVRTDETGWRVLSAHPGVETRERVCPDCRTEGGGGQSSPVSSA
jgi:PAS domain S-box-containing protein